MLLNTYSTLVHVSTCFYNDIGSHLIKNNHSWKTTRSTHEILYLLRMKTLFRLRRTMSTLVRFDATQDSFNSVLKVAPYETQRRSATTARQNMSEAFTTTLSMSLCSTRDVRKTTYPFYRLLRMLDHAACCWPCLLEEMLTSKSHSGRFRMEAINGWCRGFSTLSLVRVQEPRWHNETNQHAKRVVNGSTVPKTIEVRVCCTWG